MGLNYDDVEVPGVRKEPHKLTSEELEKKKIKAKRNHKNKVEKRQKTTRMQARAITLPCKEKGASNETYGWEKDGSAKNDRCGLCPDQSGCKVKL